MKKLKSNLAGLDNVQHLTRSQLQDVMGGVVVPPVGCTDKCSSNSDCPSGYTCYNITYPSGDRCAGCVQNETLA